MSRRLFAGAAVTTAAASLLLPILAGTASADVGDVVVRQMDASGHTVCTQNYVVANLTPNTIADNVCSGAVTATVTNDTLEPINVMAAADPEVAPGLSLKIEICMNAGFCLQILEVELPEGV